MSPEQGPFRKENRLPTSNFSMDMLLFGGLDVVSLEWLSIRLSLSFFLAHTMSIASKLDN